MKMFCSGAGMEKSVETEMDRHESCSVQRGSSARLEKGKKIRFQ